MVQYIIVPPMHEEYVKMLKDEKLRTYSELVTIVNDWKGKRRVIIQEGHKFCKFSYEPMSPHYQGSPVPATEGPDQYTPTFTPQPEEPQIIEVNEEKVAFCHC